MNLESQSYPEVQGYVEEKESRWSWFLSSVFFLVLVALIIGAAIYFQ